MTAIPTPTTFGNQLRRIAWCIDWGPLAVLAAIIVLWGPFDPWPFAGMVAMFTLIGCLAGVPAGRVRRAATIVDAAAALVGHAPGAVSAMRRAVDILRNRPDGQP